MEFEEIKKIWDMQNNETLYAINEKALHNRILSRKRSAGHIANFSELLVIFVNMATGLFVLWAALYQSAANIFIYLLTVWTLVTMLYVLVSRLRRRKNENRFDRSMLGDLNHAISNATYQVRLSGIMLWNGLPVGLLLLLGLWENGKLSVWIIIFMPVFFVVVFYASRWEHGIYKRRKRELEGLQKKLAGEEVSNPLS
jgi:Flp pilus assembly protein TadB